MTTRSVNDFEPLFSLSEELTKIQERLGRSINPVVNKAIIDGELLEDLDITTGQANLVNHRLDRPLVGWIAVRKSANAVLWDEQATNEDDRRTLDLRSSANVTVSLWVF